jgi:hypothetical protein
MKICPYPVFSHHPSLGRSALCFERRNSSSTAVYDGPYHAFSCTTRRVDKRLDCTIWAADLSDHCHDRESSFLFRGCCNDPTDPTGDASCSVSRIRKKVANRVTRDSIKPFFSRLLSDGYFKLTQFHATFLTAIFFNLSIRPGEAIDWLRGHRGLKTSGHL